MAQFSYHVSHEQFAPSELLDWVEHAEAAGFDAAFSSDHFNPWSPTQGHSGFAWSWLGAALQATRRLSFSAITVPGGWRYQPTVLAQAIATLGEMFPGRLPWVALGSGQALNESITGRHWPHKAARNERLRAGATIMRELLAGQTVTRCDEVSAVEARLWSLPEQATRLVAAATTPATARWAGAWADGLLTVGTEPEALRHTIEAFREGGGEDKPLYLKFDLSCAATEQEALSQAHAHWRFNTLGGEANGDLRRPQDFEQATRFAQREDLRSHVFMAHDTDACVERIAACAALGFASVDLHHVGRDQRGFIDVFGSLVLPQLRMNNQGES